MEMLKQFEKYLSEIEEMEKNKKGEDILESMSEEHVQAYLDIKKYIISKEIDKKYKVMYRKFRNITIKLTQFNFDISFHTGNHNKSYSEFMLQISKDNKEKLAKDLDKALLDDVLNLYNYKDTCDQIGKLIVIDGKK